MAETQHILSDDDNNQGGGGNSMSASFKELYQRRKKWFIYGGIGFVLLIILIIIIAAVASNSSSSGNSNSDITKPVVLVTWSFTDVCDQAYQAMQQSTTSYKSLDGVVSGVQWLQNKNTNSADPDSRNQITQSAMVIYGPKMESGSVTGLKNISDAVGVAKNVLIYTRHSILVGDDATLFALQTGKTLTDLSNGTDSNSKYQDWLTQNCNPHYWRNVKNGQDCTLIDGQYSLDTESNVYDITGCDANETTVDNQNQKMNDNNNELNGVVIGSVAVIAIDSNGQMSLATSANGLKYEIAGRVSDAAIPGAGGYIDPNVGGCVATGSGDELIRFAPSRTGVTYMKLGYSPTDAANMAMNEVYEFCPGKQVIVLCLSKDGVPGISGTQSYAYRSAKCTAAVSANAQNPRGTCV